MRNGCKTRRGCIITRMPEMRKKKKKKRPYGIKRAA